MLPYYGSTLLEKCTGCRLSYNRTDISRLATDLTRGHRPDKNEFAAIVRTDPDNCTVTIRRTTDEFWGTTLTSLPAGVEHELLIERGQIKSWRDPSAAVQLAQERKRLNNRNLLQATLDSAAAVLMLLTFIR